MTVPLSERILAIVNLIVQKLMGEQAWEGEAEIVSWVHVISGDPEEPGSESGGTVEEGSLLPRSLFTESDVPEREDDRVIFGYTGTNERMAEIVAELHQRGHQPVWVEEHKPSLETAFLTMTEGRVQ